MTFIHVQSLPSSNAARNDLNTPRVAQLGPLCESLLDNYLTILSNESYDTFKMRLSSGNCDSFCLELFLGKIDLSKEVVLKAEAHQEPELKDAAQDNACVTSNFCIQVYVGFHGFQCPKNGVESALEGETALA